VTFLNAGIAVLKESGLELTATEIVRIAIERGLIKSEGRTPDATLAAALYVYVRDNPHGPLRKLSQPGKTRARRDSVRWAWRE
jgi:hypothetical protein